MPQFHDICRAKSQSFPVILETSLLIARKDFLPLLEHSHLQSSIFDLQWSWFRRWRLRSSLFLVLTRRATVYSPCCHPVIHAEQVVPQWFSDLPFYRSRWT